jgi:hypothetical protein
MFVRYYSVLKLFTGLARADSVSNVGRFVFRPSFQIAKLAQADREFGRAVGPDSYQIAIGTSTRYQNTNDPPSGNAIGQLSRWELLSAGHEHNFRPSQLRKKEEEEKGTM